jgi:hypothetical protein
MKASEASCEAATNIRLSYSIGRTIRICRGILAGTSGTLAELPSFGRALIRLEQDVYLEFDQSCLELENAD